MRKIQDERLALQTLSHIRLAFIVQTLGILGILVYDVISKGISEARTNPLWFVFLLTGAVLGWLNMKVAADMDEEAAAKKPKPYYLTIVITALIGTIAALLVRFGPDHGSTSDAIITGIIVFVAFLSSYSAIRYFRSKQEK